MKRIGVDIDGVLNDFQNLLCNFLHNHYNVNPDTKSYHVLDDLHWSKQEIETFWDKFFSIVINTTKPVPYAIDTLIYLQEFYEIHIITARNYDVAKRTEEWLNKHHIPYDYLHFNCGNKVDACKWLNVDYMIEDSPYNLMALKKSHINTIKFNHPYNENIKMKLAVNNWLEILDYFI